MSEDEIRAAIARGQAEAVRMLDRWVAGALNREIQLSNRYGGRFCCELIGQTRRSRVFWGDSPEAARANAAEAIRGEL